MIEFDWGIAEFAVAAGAAALGAAYAALYLRRSRTAALLRLGALGILAFCAMKPTLAWVQVRRTKPRLVVLVDHSRTMGARLAAGTTRLDRAKAWLKPRLPEISGRASVELYAVSDRARPLESRGLGSLATSEQGLSLEAALAELLRDPHFHADRIWLITDGAGLAQDWVPRPEGGVPVDVLGIGPSESPRGLILGELRVPDFVFLHSSFAVQAEVSASRLKGAPVRARLVRGGEVLAERTFVPTEEFESFTATFTARSQTLGAESYAVEVTAPGAVEPMGAIQARSPAASGGAARLERVFKLEVIRQKLRVLYLAGRPSPEYFHLREHLKSNPNNELVSFVILRNPENLSPVSDRELALIPFPAQEIFLQDLPLFDLFILQNFSFARFNLPPSYLASVKRFVEIGGALLAIGGDQAFGSGGHRGTLLEEVLPVGLWPQGADYVPGVFSPRLADAGHPLVQLGQDASETKALWEEIAPLDGFNRFGSVKGGATVLLRHASERMPDGGAMPIAAVWGRGKGRAMVLASDTTWRWRLKGGARDRTADAYARFWGRVVDYLTGGLDLKRVRFSPLPEPLGAVEPLRVGLRVFDESFHPLGGPETDLRVLWEKPQSAPAPIPVYFEETAPGVFRGELSDLVAGTHRLKAVVRRGREFWGEDEITFRWSSSPAGALPLNRAALVQAASSLGGEYADLEGVRLGGWLSRLPPERRGREVLRRIPLWNATAWLWAVMALLVTEWFLRRRSGLP